MPKAKIDMDRIERAALALGGEGGLEAITARSLAAALGVTPMALYRHVPSIAELHARLFARVTSEAALLDHATPGLAPWLAVTFGRIRAALLAHPFVLPLAGTAAGHGAVPYGVVEGVLARLSAAGFSGDEGVRIFHALLSYTLGATALEAASRRARGADSVRAGAGAEALARHPHVRAGLAAFARAGRESAFRDDLGRLLDALVGPSGPASGGAPVRPRSRRRPSAR